MTAIKLPVIVSHNVYLETMSGSVELPDKIRPGMIKIGLGYVGIFDRKRSRTIWENSGKVIFRGKCSLGHGTKICVGGEGTLTFGENFSITAESTIVCYDKVYFGSDVLISWECLIMDTDFHSIIINNERANPNRPITVGNHVWICCRNLLLKGSNIPDGCIIAAGSRVASSFSEENCIIGGSPARVLKSSVTWE